VGSTGVASLLANAEREEYAGGCVDDSSGSAVYTGGADVDILRSASKLPYEKVVRTVSYQDSPHQRYSRKDYDSS
jgi:hypothetical protein